MRQGVWQWQAPRGARAPGAARAGVRAALTLLGVAGDVVDDAELVTSELVTNAVVHGAGEVVRAELTAGGDMLRLVVDHGSPGRAHLHHAGPEEEHGRGLAIVARLCREWGAEAGRTWCVLAVPPGGPGPEHDLRRAGLDAAVPRHPRAVSAGCPAPAPAPGTGDTARPPGVARARLRGTRRMVPAPAGPGPAGS
ncbi:ATP-binding protein [Streptomyces specialis]|uniref:ATP-binding protein n=1 Tax=Streptomyces specialis TaxID=498367 RepID=UPI00131A7211|nr:ATP-binding protein [Streptomyces specialis]